MTQEISAVYCPIYRVVNCQTQPRVPGHPMKEEEGERSEGRTFRVDRIGISNLGIRICRLICEFHRNCLSTRCLHALGQRYPPILCLALRNTRVVQPHVFAHHPTTFIVGRHVVYTLALRDSFPLVGEFRWRLLSQSVTRMDVFHRNEIVEFNLTRLRSVLNMMLIGLIVILFNSGND